MPFRIDHAELTVDEILDATDGVLGYARENIAGEAADARTIDLRLWMAASLINSTFGISIESNIRKSVDEKLAFMARAAARAGRG